MIAAGPDLLIVGGLAIDRLPDGSVLAGGSVLHGARAVAMGRRVATITAAGPEPEAVAAVAELAELGPSRVTRMSGSIRFAIHEDGLARRLVLEAVGEDLPVIASEVAAIGPRAVLLAPIAGEISATTVRACAMVPIRVAAMQGWLRRLDPGEEATALPLAALGSELSAAFAELDVLVASDEDLAAVAPRPRPQLAALRAHLGTKPLLAVTAGADGVWLDDPTTGVRHLPARLRLGEASTIGAGDAFAALLAVARGGGLDPLLATSAAMAGTVEYLAKRL